MKWKVKNGILYDEDGSMLAVLVEDLTDEQERELEMGGEASEAIRQFVSDVNSGSFKPRTAVKEFEKIIEKYS